MVDIIGYNKIAGKNGKNYAEVYYVADKNVTYGDYCGVYFTSLENALKLISSQNVIEGYNNKEKKRFLYINEK